MPTQRLPNSYPKRGEVYIANLDPGFGKEIHKKRPVLVISANILNQQAFSVVIIPFSSIVPQLLTPDMVKVPQLEGLEKNSVILVDKIRAIDKERLVKKIGTISKEKLLEVEDSLKFVLDLAEAN